MEEPEKWCIKVTPENKKAIEKWRTANALLNGKGYCVNKTSFNSMIGYWQADKPSGYTEISFEEFKVYTSKPKDLTGRYVKCLVDGAQGTDCKAGEIYKLVSLDNIVETQLYKLEDGFCLCISPTTTDKWELLPEDYSADKPLIQVVHCKTQEEWDFVSNRIGYKFITEFELGRNDTINPLSQGCESKSFFERHGKYNLLSFQEWCDLNGHKMEKEVKFEVGRWYKVCLSNQFYHIFKHIRYIENNLHVDLSPGHFDVNDRRWRNSKSFELKKVTSFTEVSLEEIQQYLPDDHPDKIKSNQGFEVGKWYKVVYRNVGKEYYLKYINNKYEFGYSEYISVSSGEHSLYNSGSDLNAMSTLIEASLEEIQQYLPDNHPDKIKSNQEFNVGDWVVVLEEDAYYSNSEKCPQKLIEVRGYSLPYRLLFKDGHNNSYEKIRHATEKEMQEYFRKNEDFLKKEIEANEYFNEILDRMKEETPKPFYHLLSVDDEELPMVNIIKTNTIKQLLNND